LQPRRRSRHASPWGAHPTPGALFAGHGPLERQRLDWNGALGHEPIIFLTIAAEHEAALAALGRSPLRPTVMSTATAQRVAPRACPSPRPAAKRAAAEDGVALCRRPEAADLRPAAARNEHAEAEREHREPQPQPLLLRPVPAAALPVLAPVVAPVPAPVVPPDAAPVPPPVLPPLPPTQMGGLPWQVAGLQQSALVTQG
jgi:hypothetical protein